MTCRSCGARIADKAIVCYRCGTSTALPTAEKPAVRAASPWGWIALALALATAAWVLVDPYPGTPRLVGAAIGAVLALGAVLRRRRAR